MIKFNKKSKKMNKIYFRKLQKFLNNRILAKIRIFLTVHLIKFWVFLIIYKGNPEF